MNNDDQFKYAYGINEPYGELLPIDLISGCSTARGYEQNHKALNGRIEGIVRKAHAILLSYGYSIQPADVKKMDFPVITREENCPTCADGVQTHTVYRVPIYLMSQ